MLVFLIDVWTDHVSIFRLRRQELYHLTALGEWQIVMLYSKVLLWSFPCNLINTYIYPQHIHYQLDVDAYSWINMDVILLILLSFNVLEFCIFGFMILQDCMALLAYEEPETSPMFSLLSMDHRQSVADALNCAILGKRDFL